MESVCTVLEETMPTYNIIPPPPHMIGISILWLYHVVRAKTRIKKIKYFTKYIKYVVQYFKCGRKNLL
jgi:hypothetical protein